MEIVSLKSFMGIVRQQLKKIVIDMFVLSVMKQVVRVPPFDFNLPLEEAIINELNKKLANKVVQNVGLCIALFDIIKIEDSFILPGDGASHTRVTFGFIVFRPFMEEVLLGKIKSSSKDGIYITMNFFDDIFIPCDALQNPSQFDEIEQIWIWNYKAEDNIHQLYMDKGEDIRFRVTSEIFSDTIPCGPNTEENASLQEQKEKKIPYQLIGTINEPGLGLLSWWT